MLPHRSPIAVCVLFAGLGGCVSICTEIPFVGSDGAFSVVKAFLIPSLFSKVSTFGCVSKVIQGTLSAFVHISKKKGDAQGRAGLGHSLPVLVVSCCCRHLLSAEHLAALGAGQPFV